MNSMWAQTRHRAIQVKNVLCTRWVMRHCDELGHVARIAEGNTIIDNRGHESDRRADAVKIGSGTQLGPYCFVSDTEAGGLDSPDMSPARGQRRIVLGGEVLFSRGPIQAQIAVFHTGVCRIGDHVYSGPSRWWTTRTSTPSVHTTFVSKARSRQQNLPGRGRYGSGPMSASENPSRSCGGRPLVTVPSSNRAVCSGGGVDPRRSASVRSSRAPEK